VKKVPIRDFDVKRVISLHWNEDVADDRLDQLFRPPSTGSNEIQQLRRKRSLGRVFSPESLKP
jgi:hypothetical protein